MVASLNGRVLELPSLSHCVYINLLGLADLTQTDIWHIYAIFQSYISVQSIIYNLL